MEQQIDDSDKWSLRLSKSCCNFNFTIHYRCNEMTNHQHYLHNYDHPLKEETQFSSKKFSIYPIYNEAKLTY